LRHIAILPLLDKLPAIDEQSKPSPLPNQEEGKEGEKMA
jgi:hypothetical protein